MQLISKCIWKDGNLISSSAVGNFNFIAASASHQDAVVLVHLPYDQPFHVETFWEDKKTLPSFISERWWWWRLVCVWLKSGKIFNRSSGPLELETLCGSSQNYQTLMMLTYISKLFLSQIQFQPMQSSDFKSKCCMNSKYWHWQGSIFVDLNKSTETENKQKLFQTKHVWFNLQTHFIQLSVPFLFPANGSGTL